MVWAGVGVGRNKCHGSTEVLHFFAAQIKAEAEAEVAMLINH